MSDRVDVILGRRLRARRRSLGLTQQQLANCCGVTFQQIQKYESASNRLSAHMVWKLACALRVEISYFFSGLSGQAGATEERRAAVDAGQHL